MSFDTIQPEWPPVPIHPKKERRAKRHFFRHTTDYIKQFNPSTDIRHLLNHTKPDDQNTYVSTRQLYGVDALVDKELYIPYTDNITTFDLEYETYRVNEMHVDVSSCIYFRPKQKRITEYGTHSFAEHFIMDNSVCSDLINMWTDEHRLLLAHILTLNYIQMDEGMCHLFNKEVPEDQQIKCDDATFDDDDDEEEPWEKLVMAGDAPDDDDDEIDISPQEHYEYFVLHQFFQKVIEGKL